MNLPSRFQIGDAVNYRGRSVKVVGVFFTEDAVRYDLKLSNGEVRQAVQSGELSDVSTILRLVSSN